MSTTSTPAPVFLTLEMGDCGQTTLHGVFASEIAACEKLDAIGDSAMEHIDDDEAAQLAVAEAGGSSSNLVIGSAWSNHDDEYPRLLWIESWIPA